MRNLNQIKTAMHKLGAQIKARHLILELKEYPIKLNWFMSPLCLQAITASEQLYPLPFNKKSAEFNLCSQ